MPYIMNALSHKEVHTQATGKWFTWKPSEIKLIHNENIAAFLESNRGYEGLIGIPEQVMELDKNSQEYKSAIEERQKDGFDKRLRYIDSIIHNQEISLRGDLETHNIKADPLSFASKGMVQIYKERALMAEFEKSRSSTPGDEIRKIKAQMEGTAVDGNSNSSQSGTNPPGRANPVKPTASGK